MHNFTDFPAAKFPEIRTQHVDQCGDESFPNRTLKLLPYEVIFPKTQKNSNLFQRPATVGWSLTSLFSTNKPISERWEHLVTLGHHNSAMIIDQPKFITKWSLYGMSSFHYHHWNQFKVILLACTLRTRNLPQKFFASNGTSRHATMSKRWWTKWDGLITSFGERKDRSFNEITANWVVLYRHILSCCRNRCRDVQII